MGELRAQIAEFKDQLANDAALRELLQRMPKAHFLLQHFDQFATKFEFLGLLSEQGLSIALKNKIRKLI